jgi:Flp pilus assembly protein TadB
MTDEDDKKPKDPGVYRESPPDAPAPAPVQPSEYQRQRQADAEVQRFQQQVRDPTAGKSGGKTAQIAAAGGIGCMAVVLWIVAIVGAGVLVVIGLVIFTCSR